LVNSINCRKNASTFMLPALYSSIAQLLTQLEEKEWGDAMVHQALAGTRSAR
jgi:hypothetical protein